MISKYSYDFLVDTNDELYLNRQFDIVWKGDTDSKQLITRIIAGLISNHTYITYSDMYEIISRILL